MQKEQIIEIPYSKIKISLLFIACLALVAFGIWVFNTPIETKRFSGLRNPTTVKIGASMIIIYFGFVALVLPKMLFQKKPMLILDDAGITNNMKYASAKYVPWTDVESMEILSIKSRKIILIKVKNPEDYINNQPGLFKKKRRQLEYKVLGTPVSLSTVILKISSKKLVELINAKIEKHNALKKNM